MEKNKLNLNSILFLFICISSCFALLPSCYLEDKKCGLEANNLLSWDSSTDIETCRERCQNYQDPNHLTSICNVFTYFGPNSSPFENMCFLLSSCPDIYPCEGCITESVQSCLCSLPHECYSGPDNILAILEGVPFEEACRQICFDTNKPEETCTTYTFYDDESQESPRICVLHKGCEKISPEPCVGCHTGPRSCASSEDEECNFAVWSPSMEAGVMVTENQTVTLMSGEQNCYKEVKALAVGGGGGALSFRGGGGSGYVANESFNVTAHTNLMVTVGNGGSENIPATASAVTYKDSTVVGAAGHSANSFNGSDGYSGGGAQGANGGENGGNGGNFGNSFGGHGEGSDVDLGSLSSFKYALQPGRGGVGNNSIGGGGGGGVVVVVEEIELSPAFNDYQGKGFGGGAGGYSETSGLSGCVILEL